MTGSFKWFLFFWLAFLYLLCSCQMKPPSLPSIQDNQDQTILVDLIKPILSDKDYQRDIELAYHLLSKRLCTDSDNSISPPLSFPCFFGRSNDDTGDTIPVVADAEASFDYIEYHNGYGSTVHVLDKIVDYFETCPEDSNFEILSDKFIAKLNLGLRSKIQEEFEVRDGVKQESEWTQAQLSAKTNFFNFKRKPCCRIPKGAQTGIDPFITKMMTTNFPFTVENFTPDSPSFYSLKSSFKKGFKGGLDSALGFLIGYGSYLSKGHGHEYRYIFTEAQTLLALRWKAEGYIGEALQCLRAAQYNAFRNKSPGSGFFDIPPINSLGIFTRTVFFYDKHPEFLLTKQLLNYTLFHIYDAFSLLERENQIAGSRHTQAEKARLELLQNYELRSQGMCSAILTLFDLMLRNQVSIITNKREESDWETHIRTNKVGLDFARWMLKIWSNRCRPLDLDSWHDERIADMIIKAKPDFLSHCIWCISNFIADNCIRKLPTNVSLYGLLVATLIIVVYFPQEEDEQRRASELDARNIRRRDQGRDGNRRQRVGSALQELDQTFLRVYPMKRHEIVMKERKAARAAAAEANAKTVDTNNNKSEVMMSCSNEPSSGRRRKKRR